MPLRLGRWLAPAGCQTQAAQTKRGARSASFGLAAICLPLEVSGATFVAAIAIQLDRLAGTFARRAAILAPRLWWTRTNRILTLCFLVCHASLLVSSS